MRPHREIFPRFVEADVPITADAEQLQIDTAGSSNRDFVTFAFGIQVRSYPVEKMNPFGAEVDPVEQVTLHELSEASRMTCVDASELVEVECRGARPIGITRRMPPPQLGVTIDGSTSRGEAEHGVRPGT